MENDEDYSIKIAAYFDDAMTASEEETFMQALSRNETLRQQFEDELLVRSLLNEGAADESSSKKDLLLQPADEHLAVLEQALNEKGRNKPAPVVPMFRRYRAVAAVVIAFVAIALLLLLTVGKKSQTDTIAGGEKPKDSVAKMDTAAGQKNVPLPQNLQDYEAAQNNKNQRAVSIFDSTKKVQLPIIIPDSFEKKPLPDVAQRKIADSIYRLFYTPYASQADPPELYEFSQALEKGDYATVRAATDADVQSKGSGSRDEMLKQYLHLYKGLSYLTENKPLQAIPQFNDALNAPAKTNTAFFSSQWYCALAWLKAGDVGKASALLKAPSGTGSPYASKAEKLLEALSHQ